MEIHSPSLETLVTFLLFMLILFKLRNRFKANKQGVNLPPGPWKLPFIGNMHHLVGSQPHHALRDLSTKYGPIMYLKLGEVPTIVVSSPEVAKEVMKTHDVTFASRPELLAVKIMSYECTDIAFSPYSEYWRQLRKICVSELLTLKRVQSFRSVREEEVSSLVQWISSNAGLAINLTEKVYSSTYTITSRVALGSKWKEQETLISIVLESITLAAGFDMADVYPSVKLLQMFSPMRYRVQKLQQKADGILETIINDHKVRNDGNAENQSEKHEDLIDVLLKFQEDGNEVPLTTDNIKAVILDVFSAGSETSATTVDWAMAEMLKTPRILKTAQDEVRKVYNGKGYVDETCLQELKYLKLVIKETLRLHPPLPLILPRECRRECNINGYDIPIKARILVNAWAIGRDPKHWENSEMFSPERFLDTPVDYKGNSFEYIPFGAGRRMCPGITFGLANVELPLASFLYHFDWSLPDGLKEEELSMTETFGVTVRRKEELLAIPVVKIPFQVK